MLQLLQWDGNVPTTHHFFIIVITPQGSSLTHLHLIVQTLSPITFIMRLLFFFFLFFFETFKDFHVSGPVKLLDMYNRIKSPNASYAAPVCYANRSVLMKASWIIQEWCSTTNTPQEQILRKKKKDCFGKIKSEVSLAFASYPQLLITFLLTNVSKWK